MTTATIPARKEKLLRVQGPRSHAGCRTCKLRHVKCDEARPHCTQCIKAKRPCHYVDEPRDQVVKFIVYASHKEPTPFPGLTSSEKRSLDYFQNRTAEELPSPFRSELWSNIVLHVAQYAPSIRHAVFALSSMHEYYASGDESRGALYDYSMHHYNKAIRQVLRIEPDQSFDTLLLSSVMFCALEGLKGNFEVSLQHALAGIKIIARGRDNLPTNPDQPQIPDHKLPNIFLSLQTQAFELGDLSVFSLYQSVQREIAPMPGFFADTEEALWHCTAVMHEMMVWFQEFEAYWGDTAYIPAKVPLALQQGFDQVRQRFAMWDAAMQHVDTVTNGGDGNQHKGYLVLKLYQSILRIVFRTLDEGIYRFDTFETEVGGMLSLAEVFLQSQGNFADPSQAHSLSSGMAPDIAPRRARPMFSLALGVVPILFEIATSTRKPELRSHAIRLLSSCHRREGVWDSRLACRLAQKHIELQDEVDRNTEGTGQEYRVFITDMDFRTDKKLMFKYTIVLSGPHMMDSFWLSGFNDKAHESFQGEV